MAVPADIRVSEQLEIARRTVAQTTAGKIDWQETGASGTYRSVRSDAVAVLDRVGEGEQLRVRLRFSSTGQTDFDIVITQALVDGEALREEQDLDAQLELLYSRVDRKSVRHRSSATRFLDNET